MPSALFVIPFINVCKCTRPQQQMIKDRITSLRLRSHRSASVCTTEILQWANASRITSSRTLPRVARYKLEHISVDRVDARMNAHPPLGLHHRCWLPLPPSVELSRAGGRIYIVFVDRLLCVLCIVRSGSREVERLLLFITLMHFVATATAALVALFSM